MKIHELTKTRVFTNILLIRLQTAASVKDYLPQIDLSNIIKKLDSLTSIPCHLVKDSEESYENIR